MPRHRPSPQADLVAGASGFLGTQLVERLLRNPRARVLALSRRPRAARPRVAPLAHDLARPLDGLALPERIGHVYQCASPPSSSTDLRALRAANVDGTLRLLDYAVRAGARGFVYVSSGGVCRGAAGPIPESAPLRPASAYLAAKAEAERALARAEAPLPLAVVRLFFPYGPGQLQGLLPRLCRLLSRGEAVRLDPSGGPRLNPVHVRDAARLIQAIARGGSGAALVNVAGGRTVSMAWLVRALARRLGVRPVQVRDPLRQPSLVADLRRLRRYGRPRLGLEAGLTSFVRGWRPPRG